MSVTVTFPALFAERIGGIETVQEALRVLTDRHAELAPLVWHPEAGLNPVMAVFLNGRQLDPEDLATPVHSGDQIQILSALEGGEAAT